MPLRRLLPVLLASMTLLGLGGIAQPASAMIPSSSCDRPAVTTVGHIRGMVLPLHAHASSMCPMMATASAAVGAPPLLYHGGPVMAAGSTGSVTVTPVWWVPSGFSIPSTYQSLVTTFLKDVAADSGRAGNVFSPLTQYTDGSSQHIRYHLVAGAGITDTTPFPTGCSPDTGTAYTDGTTYSRCVTDANVGNELTALISQKGLPNDRAHLYVVLLPKRVEACGDVDDIRSGGDCSAGVNGGTFCAFHSSSGSSTLYALMPFENSYACSAGQSPNGVADADALVGPLSHEMNEAITDPLGTAWYDSGYYENGDECAWIFGAAYGSSGAMYNQTINGHHYYLQEEFSNESYRQGTGGCVQHQSLPKAVLTTSATTIALGAPVSFSAAGSSDTTVGSLSSYSWDFGDSVKATGATSSHRYSNPGTYTTTLTVADADGWQAKATSVIKVGPRFAPGAPTTVGGAQASSSTATLKWSPPSNPGSASITGYVVSRDGTDSSGTGAYSASVSVTTRSFTFTKLVTGRTYNLSVRAISRAGTGAMATVATPIASTSAVAAPSAASVVESTAATATITWQPPTTTAGKTITGYRVSRNGVNSAGVGAFATTVGSSARSYSMAQLVSGSTYTLSVRAITAAGAGPAASSQIIVRPYVGAPQGVTAVQSSAASATVTWHAPTTLSRQTVTGYVVSRNGTDTNGTGVYLTTVSPGTTSFTMRYLVVGQTYTLSVQTLTMSSVSAPAAGKVTVTF